MIRKALLVLTITFIAVSSYGASVDTVEIYSNAMHKSFICVVIRPDAKKRKAAKPVVYLLHGYSGSYFDSPIDSSSRYETYIGREVPDYIDAHYNTIKDRTGRAITGLSMGGHGGLFLGFHH